jgi:hypothetical protein
LFENDLFGKPVPTFPDLSLAFTTVEAWIPDTLRFAPLTHEVGNDGVAFFDFAEFRACDLRRRKMPVFIPALVSD